MGEGILKDSVPEAHTDYVIAVISEEYGALVNNNMIIFVHFIELSKIVLIKRVNLLNFFKWFSNITNFSNIYSRWCERKFATYNRNDFTFLKLWWIISYWKCNFGWISFELYKKQNLLIWLKKNNYCNWWNWGTHFPTYT